MHHFAFVRAVEKKGIVIRGHHSRKRLVLRERPDRSPVLATILCRSFGQWRVGILVIRADHIDDSGCVDVFSYEVAG